MRKTRASIKFGLTGRWPGSQLGAYRAKIVTLFPHIFWHNISSEALHGAEVIVAVGS